MATSLAVVMRNPVHEPCCAERCKYRPARVAWLLREIEEAAQSGYTPCEVMATVFSRDNLPGGAFGPGMRRGLDDVADIGRAIKAGKRSPVEIARFLCPFAETDCL